MPRQPAQLRTCTEISFSLALSLVLFSSPPFGLFNYLCLSPPFISLAVPVFFSLSSSPFPIRLLSTVVSLSPDLYFVFPVSMFFSSSVLYLVLVCFPISSSSAPLLFSNTLRYFFLHSSHPPPPPLFFYTLPP